MDIISRLSTLLADQIFGKEKAEEPEKRSLTNAERRAAGQYELYWQLAVSIPCTLPGAGPIDPKRRLWMPLPEHCFLLHEFEHFIQVQGWHISRSTHSASRPDHERLHHEYEFRPDEDNRFVMRDGIKDWFNQKFIETAYRGTWFCGLDLLAGNDAVQKSKVVHIDLRTYTRRDD